MKKHKRNITTQTVLTTAAFLALQSFPNLLHAQTAGAKPQTTTVARKASYFLKIDMGAMAHQKMALVGVIKGEPVFKNGKGEIFRLNSNTGDIITVSKEEFAKLDCCMKDNGGGYFIKMATLKNSSSAAKSNIFIKLEKTIANIKVLGIDKDGHIIQETEKGEKFFLDPATGDMVDYVGHVTLMK